MKVTRKGTEGAHCSLGPVESIHQMCVCVQGPTRKCYQLSDVVIVPVVGRTEGKMFIMKNTDEEAFGINANKHTDLMKKAEGTVLIKANT